VKKVEKPWGYEIIFAHTEKYAGKVLFIKAGHRLSLQSHAKKEETFYIYSGRLRMVLEDEQGERSVELRPGDSQHLLPGVRHRPEALEDTTVFEVSTPELEDVIRYSDDYGRTTEEES